MKKFYALAVVLSFLAGSASAQDFYWIGAANGDWSNTANWSNTSGGPSAGAYPDGTGHNVILDANASIRLNISVNLNSLSVTGTTTQASITGSGGGGDANPRILTVNSTSAGSPGLLIQAGCRLENSAINGTYFQFTFADNGKASINGEWLFTGDIEQDNFAYFLLPETTGQTTAVSVNSGGAISIGANTIPPANEFTGDDYLIFNSGATLNILGSFAIVPAANYQTGSVVNITGVTNEGVSIEETGSLGTINYNCPNQAASVSLTLLSRTIKGNFNILGTNNNELILIPWFSITGLPNRTVNINGNLNIQGNSVVSVAHSDGPEEEYFLNVGGNLVMGGTSLSLFTGTFINSKPVKVSVAGHIQHTAGTIGVSSSVVNETTDLYVIELNGTSNQNISTVTGSFDNAGNQVTLRMNNSAGATLMNSLQVGRIDFSSANKGVLSTGSNILYVANAAPNSVSSKVVNSPSATGYVNGIVRRRTSSTEPFVLPTGAASGYRPVTLIPSSTTTTTFQATHFNTGYSDLSVASPLEGVTPDYYWTIDRISGTADAAVQLSVPGQVTGSQADYALVIAKYNGIDWVNEKGSTGLSVSPGDASSGTLRSQVQTSFSPFTIGYALASALPTHLVSFTGRKAAKETIELKWQITDNSTPERFEVTRSSDGVNFVKIGSVAGAEYVRSYGFTDNSILAGNNYYRLRMLDKDGAVTFSTIVVVSNGAQGVYLNSVTPSVVQGRTRLNIQSSENTSMQLMVTDINGRIVHKQSISLSNGSQDVWLDVSRFSSGVFQVTGFVKGVKTATLRFIKL